MIRLRLQLAAFAALTVVVAMTGAPLAQALAERCVLPHHDCGTSAKMARCCCEDRGAQSDATPVQARVDVRDQAAAPPALPRSVQPTVTPPVLHRVDETPSWRCLLDLPTLFAVLLI